MENNNIIYQVGMRDMLANLFMEIRINGETQTLTKYAEILKGEDNVHAKWYLDKKESK